MLSFFDIAPEAFPGLVDGTAAVDAGSRPDGAEVSASPAGESQVPAGDPVGEGLPAYTVRVSPRARRARLTVTPRDGLVVVIPTRFPRGRVEGLVEEHRLWALRALANVAERHALFSAGPEAMLPETVEFAATAERFDVVRDADRGGSVQARLAGDVVRLTGGTDDAEACLAALNRWLDRAARERLVPRAAELAGRHGFAPSAIRTKRQKMRWGSCTARAAIALNRTLLFLPPELCDAVILHELVHTTRLDHSPRFWADLAAVDPRALEHRARLRDAGALVPPWADG